MQMVMTSDETQIKIFANWPMSHAKRVTRDNRKNPEYRVIAAIRKLRTDKLSRRRIMGKPCKKWAAYRIWKDLRPQKYWTAEHNDAKDRKRKCLRKQAAFSFAVLCIIMFCYLVFAFLRGKNLELAALVTLLARLPVNYRQLSRTSLAVWPFGR